MITLESLEHDLDQLPGDEIYELPLHKLRQMRETIAVRIQMVRSATVALAEAEREIVTETEWRDNLIGWRKILADEYLALPRRIRTDEDRGKSLNLELSIITIDRGLNLDGSGHALATLRLGALMRQSGYQESPRVENQIAGALPWYGSLPAVERRIQELTNRRDDAQRRLTDALMDPDERAADIARIQELQSLPTRKTRGDGSQYDKYPDGRIVEIGTAVEVT